MRLWGILVSATVALLSSVCAAQQVVLRWNDIEQAVGRHPAVALAQDEIALAQGEAGLARQYPNPELGLSLGQGRSVQGDEQSAIWGVELTVPIESPGAYTHAGKAADAQIGAAKSRALGTRIEVIRELKALYIRIAADQQRIETLRLSRDRIEHLARVAGTRVDRGEARPMELARLEIELEKVRIDLSSASQAAALRKQTMNLWLGGGLPRDYLVEFDLTDLPELAPVDQAVEKALTHHPEVSAAAAEEVSAAARLRSEQAERFPDISVGGFYDRELDAHNFGAVLSVALPIWNRNSGGIESAKARMLEARHATEMTRLHLEAAVRDAHARASQSLVRVRGYRDVILPKSLETVRAMERMYQIGEVGVMDMLDAKRGQIEIEEQLLEAMLEAQLTQLELTALTGGLNAK